VSEARRSRGQGLSLLLVAALLIAQFALRAHHPGAQAAFLDEHYHIRRAELVYSFDRNPIEFANGKLLFYYWLGLFAPQRESALIVGRLGVALWSLITSAALAAAARALFGRGAALPALAFYALAPFAVFFERMALADPFAGGLAALVVWQSVRLARRPGVRRGLATGALVGLMLVAKLTTLFLAGLPFLAGMLAASPPLVEGWRAAWLRRLRWHRRAWLAVLAGGSAVFGVYLLLMAAYALAGQQPKFFTAELTEVSPGAFDLGINFLDMAQAAVAYLSLGMAAALTALAALVVLARPRAGLLTLAWLLGVGIPMMALGNPLRTRYLVAGLPALAVIFGGGAAVLRRRLGARAGGALIAGGLAVWAAVFALPFARQASTHPDELDLPAFDVSSYFSGPYNAYATRDALAWLERYGLPDPQTGRVRVVGALHRCGPADMVVSARLAWTCTEARDFAEDAVPPDPRRWTPLRPALREARWVYVVTEAPLVEFPLGGLAWDPLFSAQRPRGGWIVTVWRVARLAPPG